MASDSTKIFLILLFLAAGGITILNTMTPLQAQSLSSNQTHNFTIIVSRYGFNGTAGSFRITVQQGESVKVTFVYGDDDLTVDNPHAIMIDGYRIQTVNIGKTNPSVTVEFSADVAGTFNFYCYVPCVGMENLLGHLTVTPSQNQLIPTTLSLASQSPKPVSNSLQISATVRDQNGEPMTGIPVNFYENTTFGRLFLGMAKTDSSGVATLNYTASRTGNVEIIAEDLGNAQFAGSSKSILIAIATKEQSTATGIYLGVKQPAQLPNPFYGISYPPNLSMIGVPRITNIFVVAIAGMIVLGVWSTYAYVGRQIIRIRKIGEDNVTEEEQFAPMLVQGYMPPAIRQDQIPLTRGVGLTLLTLALGAIDMLIVNSFSFSFLLSTLSIVGLALVETVAVVTLMSSRETEH